MPNNEKSAFSFSSSRKQTPTSRSQKTSIGVAIYAGQPTILSGGYMLYTVYCRLHSGRQSYTGTQQRKPLQSQLSVTFHFEKKSARHARCDAPFSRPVYTSICTLPATPTQKECLLYTVYSSCRFPLIGFYFSRTVSLSLLLTHIIKRERRGRKERPNRIRDSVRLYSQQVTVVSTGCQLGDGFSSGWRILLMLCAPLTSA